MIPSFLELPRAFHDSRPTLPSFRALAPPPPLLALSNTSLATFFSFIVLLIVLLYMYLSM